jgi:hypothetical protein
MSTTADDDQLFPTPENTIVLSGTGNGWGSVGDIYTSVPLGAGAIGATGSFSLPSGTMNIPSISTGSWSMSQNLSNVSMSTSILSIMAEGDGDAMIKTKKNTINLDEMASMMETVKERLLILTPNFELHEKYPALKEAYEHYKVLEAMMAADDK